MGANTTAITSQTTLTHGALAHKQAPRQHTMAMSQPMRGGPNKFAFAQAPLKQTKVVLAPGPRFNNGRGSVSMRAMDDSVAPSSNNDN